MRQHLAAFWEKHPVISVILAIVVAINLIPLLVFGFKIAIPILLIVGVISVVRMLSRDSLEPSAERRHLS